jgi:undecaprenyl-diphosphatase
MRRHGLLHRFLRSRMSSETATGLALTVAAVVLAAAAVAYAVLVALLRRDAGTIGIDVDVAGWASRVASEPATAVLRLFTDLGSTRVLVPLAIVIAIVEIRRVPSRAVIGFLAVVVIGQNLLSNGIKLLVDRVRPAIDPLTTFSGPSFPSGHTTAAAACFAAFALVLGRRRSLQVKALLGGAAVAIAVGVGATRVLLGVHWFTDVVGGLALGWAWFAIGSVAFGGRLLRFGAPVAAAARVEARNVDAERSSDKEHDSPTVTPPSTWRPRVHP